MQHSAKHFESHRIELVTHVDHPFHDLLALFLRECKLRHVVKASTVASQRADFGPSSNQFLESLASHTRKGFFRIEGKPNIRVARIESVRVLDLHVLNRPDLQCGSWALSARRSSVDDGCHALGVDGACALLLVLEIAEHVPFLVECLRDSLPPYLEVVVGIGLLAQP